MLVERYESIKGKGISTGEELGHPLAERPRQLLMLVMKIGVLKPSDRILHVTLDVQELIDTGQRSESITVAIAMGRSQRNSGRTNIGAMMGIVITMIQLYKYK